MIKAGFSKSNLQRARIRHDHRSWGISCMYGIITKASTQGEEERVQVGERTIFISQLEKELTDLYHATGRKYDCLIIEGGNAPRAFWRGELETVCTVGMDVPSLMYAYEQSQTGLVESLTLRKIIARGPTIIRDLKKLGFAGIDTSDLYLHAEAYRH